MVKMQLFQLLSPQFVAVFALDSVSGLRYNCGMELNFEREVPIVNAPQPRCECEHTSHFADEETPRTRHEYRMPIACAGLEFVTTQYGRYWLCDTCQGEGHMLTN
jgi:hypothetical protein